MPDFVTKPRLVAALLTLSMAGVFALDSLTPPGIGDGIGYAVVMTLCLWLPGKRAVLATAAACTALTITAQFLTPEGGIGELDLINRAFVIAVIWVNAALLYQRKKTEPKQIAGERAAREGSAAKSKSLANASHELWTAYLSPMGGICVALLGAGVLVGWWTNTPSLTTVLPGLVAMRPITAVAFVFSGGALFLFHFQARPARWAARASAVLAGLIGVLTLVDYATSFNFGIDQWLFERLTAPNGAAAPVWRMSYFASSSFTMFVAVLLTLDAKAAWLRRISNSLGIVGHLIAALALLGYAYDVNSLYEFMGTAPTALHTATAFFVLFTSAALAVPNRGWVAMLIGDGVGSTMMRRLLLATVTIPLIIGFLVINFGRYHSINPNFGIAILALSTVFVLAFVVWQSTTFLDQLDADRLGKEAALRANQAMLATAESVAGVGSWDWDVPGNKLIWSEEHCRLFGYRPEASNATNENWLARVHPDDKNRVQEAADTAMAGQKTYDIDYRIVLPDGTERVINSKGEVFRDSGGKAIRMVGTVHDITERKRAEEALHDSEERLSQAVRVSGIGIYDHDQRTDTVYWSPEQRKIFGWSPDETVTLQKYFDAVHPEDWERIVAAVRRAHDPGEDVPYDIEHRILRRDGEVRWMTTRVHTFFEGEGEARRAVRTVGAMLDITERKRAEEALRQSEVQLRQAQKMEAVGQLTGGVAHDFNNLLSVIMGNLELILERAETDPALKKLAQAALDGSLRGAELTQRLLAYSRKQSLQPRITNLGERLPQMSALLHRTLGEQTIVKIDPAAGLWPVLVDPSQIDDSILNLALNARDAMPKGGTLTIEAANTRLDDNAVGDLAAGDYVLLTVSDTGTGMPPEVVERVFEPFYTTKDVGKGSGLGLSMVYGFVKQSKGHIKIYSEVGRGTTVNIFLPRAETTSAIEVAPGAVVANLSANDELILVVEDNEAVRSVVVKQLTDLGYRTLQVETGEAALALLDKHPDIDLVFSDVVMRGGMDGYELARQARKRRTGLKILLMSGFTMKSMADVFQDAEEFELLKKPYRKHDLAHKLRQLFTPQQEAGRPVQ